MGNILPEIPWCTRIHVLYMYGTLGIKGSTVLYCTVQRRIQVCDGKYPPSSGF